VTAVSRELLRIFDASAVDVVIQDFETRHDAVARRAARRHEASRRALHLELDPAQQAA